MENENKNFEGFLGEVSGGESSKGQGMHMDPSIASLFQAFLLLMQQQQSNDRKEALATKVLQAVVNKIDQFDGKNISRYLRCYVREMELNRVSEKKMVALFGLATIPEIRNHITSITDRCGNSWEDFSHALKDEYFLEDADRVTKKLFLGWIERPNKNLQATELLREFERQYSQLSKVEKLTLEPNKVDLFLQAADGELQEKLEPLLEDKEKDEGLTTKWKNVEDAVGDIEEPIVALVDHGSEINLMSKDLYKKQKWPIDMEHGWAIRVANNTRGELYGACPDVKIRIGDVAMEQHFFVQDTTSYPLILGQPYIMTTCIETKILDDGSAYARVRSEDGRKAVQFLIVPPNHERNRDRLREKPLPKIVEGFKDFGEQEDESDMDNEGDDDELDKDVEDIF
uniref:Predicted protein n=1 Tax=Physcomitrium patens TaxID=3218 RepID=A9U3C5_PHYPA